MPSQDSRRQGCRDLVKPCQLDPEKWRVARFTVEVAKNTVAVRPWQLPPPTSVPAPLNIFSVWGIWPPNWDITDAPLLYFPMTIAGWRQAFNAAWSRAQFAAVPPIKQPNLLSTPQFDEREINGEA
jgi:hypothetical protein